MIGNQSIHGALCYFTEVISFFLGHLLQQIAVMIGDAADGSHGKVVTTILRDVLMEEVAEVLLHEFSERRHIQMLTNI